MKKRMKREIIIIYSRNASKKIFNSFYCILGDRGLNLTLIRLFYLTFLFNVDYFNDSIRTYQSQ